MSFVNYTRLIRKYNCMLLAFSWENFSNYKLLLPLTHGPQAKLIRTLILHKHYYCTTNFNPCGNLYVKSYSVLFSDGSCSGRTSNDALVLLDHRHKCYRFSTAKVAWSTARDSCSTEGGTLVEVIDGSLQKFLTQQAMNIEENFGIEANWWIGGYDDRSATDRAWFWMDSKSIKIY